MEIVHPVPLEACDAFFASMAQTFLEDPAAPGGLRRQRTWRPERRWGAYDRGRWVATLGSYEQTLSVPGGSTVPADALSMVTVAPTHRRQGILTSMLTDSLRAAHERGDAVSILIAAEWPIYGRYGYAPATQSASYTAHPRVPGGTLSWDGPPGVRQVSAAEFGAVAHDVFDRARRQRGGNIGRAPVWWDGHLGLNGLEAEVPSGAVQTLVVHEGPDGVDGLLSWRPTRESVLGGAHGAILVRDLATATHEAYRGLWQYLTGMDLVEEIVLYTRPVDEPVRWLLPDGRTLDQTKTMDGLWLRLLDVAATLSARTYACTGRLVLEVLDDAPGGYAAGRYAVDGGPDGASCVRSQDSPDLRLSQRALASACLGGFTLRARAALVEELTPGAIALADAMFSTGLAPWCATGF